MKYFVKKSAIAESAAALAPIALEFLLVMRSASISFKKVFEINLYYLHFIIDNIYEIWKSLSYFKDQHSCRNKFLFWAQKR